jgi:hypothetical protein
MKIKLVDAFLMSGVFVYLAFLCGAKIGMEKENTRIYNCYMAKDFSGFAWVDDSKYFTCSADIRKGKVYYTREK